MSPSITVLMACRNGGPYLDLSLASIHSQVFRDWEMIVVDDGSEDGSEAVAEAWARRDARIRVVRNPGPHGQTPALNYGLSLARGKWIARQDADDLSHPWRLLRQYQAVTASPGLALLGSAGRIISGSGRLCGLLDVPLHHGLILRAACFLNPFVHTAVLFEAQTVREEMGGYDERFAIAQDYDLWSRLARRHLSANLRARLVAYRHLASSLSKAGRRRAFTEAGEIAGRHAAELFPGLLDEEDIRALTAFREGRMRPGDLPTLRRAWSKLRLEAEAGGRAYRAALELRAAGMLGHAHPAAAASCLARALLAAPGFVGSWLVERARP